MHSHAKLLKALRGQGYSFKRRATRTEIYKKKGSVDRITLSINKTHDPNYCMMILRKAGMSDAEVEAFLAN